mmetsp:Transcript_14846/g.31677  ORF Transcript_14846/g.31677 Transcript_14846/m.31677 type:complete len:95 (-) Transcript_14846:1842-2126(-)
MTFMSYSQRNNEQCIGVRCSIGKATYTRTLKRHPASSTRTDTMLQTKTSLQANSEECRNVHKLRHNHFSLNPALIDDLDDLFTSRSHNQATRHA